MAAERCKLLSRTTNMRPQSVPQQPRRLCIISWTQLQYATHTRTHTTIRRHSLVICLQYSYIIYEPFRTQHNGGCVNTLGVAAAVEPPTITLLNGDRQTTSLLPLREHTGWWGVASNYFYLLPAAMWRHWNDCPNTKLIFQLLNERKYPFRVSDLNMCRVGWCRVFLSHVVYT